jgi:hypothetical protein
MTVSRTYMTPASGAQLVRSRSTVVGGRFLLAGAVSPALAVAWLPAGRERDRLVTLGAGRCLRAQLPGPD